jgi:LPXTG-motif cell wall-anchored protein
VSVLLLLACSSAGLVAPAAAVARPAGALVPRAASSVDQQVLTFANLMPGETARQYLVLSVSEPTQGTVVRAEVDGSASLLPFVLTGVRSCDVAWQAGVCPSGLQTLLPLESVPASQALAIPVQAQDTLYLEVSVGVTDDVPQGANGQLTYVVSLEGAELVPPTTTTTSPPSPSPSPSPSETTQPSLQPPTEPQQPPAQPLRPLLPRTGAEVMAYLVAGLSLIGLGAALRTWARRRRRV